MPLFFPLLVVVVVLQGIRGNDDGRPTHGDQGHVPCRFCRIYEVVVSFSSLGCLPNTPYRSLVVCAPSSQRRSFCRSCGVGGIFVQRVVRLWDFFYLHEVSMMAVSSLECWSSWILA